MIYKGFWHFLITNLYRFISVYRSGTVFQVKNGFPIKLEFCGVYPKNDNFIYTNSAHKKLSIPWMLLYKYNATKDRYHRNDFKQIESSLSRYIKSPYKELIRYEIGGYNNVFIKPLSARVLKNRDIFIHYDTDYYFHNDVDVDDNSDDEESNKIPIESYNGRQLENYYYDCEEDAFYCYKDNEYKELLPKMQRDGTKYVYMYDVTGYRFKLCIKKFKKLHKLN